MRKSNLIYSLALLSSLTAYSQKTLINHVTIHTGTGRVIENGAVGIENGKISYVGNSPGSTQGYEHLIDGQQAHLYPGIIAPNSTLGLVEIEAVRATRDAYEIGEFNPNVRSLIAYNAESDVTATAVTNGVLMAQISPRGGRISGSSSIVQFKAWNWEDAAYVKDDGIHLEWPSAYSWSRNGLSKSKNYEDQYREMVHFLELAKAYNQEASPLNDLRLAAMKGIFAGTQTLYVHAYAVKELREAIQLKKTLDIPKMVLVGAYDAIQIVDELKANNIPVILQRVHSLPARAEDDVDLPYKLPFLLHKAGILVALNNEGDMEQAGVRNLPFYAGTAAAYGLSKEEALQTITINTAKILGIDSRCGSVEVGKDATLFISSGDALDMRSNNLTHAWIKGESVNLSNRQMELYQKYKDKYKK